MTDGVVILQELTEVTYLWHWTQWATIAAIVALVGLVGWWGGLIARNEFAAQGNKQRRKIAEKIVFACILIFFIGTTATVCACRYGEKVETKSYQVLLEDGVQISAFREHYEIIGEQGITYIVRERK